MIAVKIYNGNKKKKFKNKHISDIRFERDVEVGRILSGRHGSER